MNLFLSLKAKTDGNWAKWGEWGTCDADKKQQTRTRTCSNPAPAPGGGQCPGSATETKTCDPPGEC